MMDKGGVALVRLAAATACVAIAGILATGSGCNLLLDLNSDQCDNDNDCQLKGASFQNTRCVDRVCQSNSVATGGGGGVGGDGGGSTTGCSTNLECFEENGNLPYICRQSDKTCVPILSEDCIAISDFGTKEGFKSDNALIWGFMFHFTGGFAFIGPILQDAADMALKEITASLPAGLPGGANGESRPIVMVICDDEANPQRAAKHLVDDLGVQAILGPQFNEEMFEVSTTVTIPAEVLTFCGPCGNPQMAAYNDQGFMWGAIPNDVQIIRAYGARLKQLDDSLPDPVIRVALVASGAATDQGMAAAAEPYLKFNGEPGGGPLNPNYTKFDYDEVRQTGVYDYNPLAAQVAAFAPHVVLIIAPFEHAKIVLAIETAHVGAAPLPNYVLSLKVPEVADLAVDDNLRQRVTALDIRNDPELLATFQSNYKAFTGVMNPQPNVHFTYDSVYALAYAHLANDNFKLATGQITAKVIVDGLNALTPGEGAVTRDIGAPSVNEIVNVLLGGGRVDLNGVGSNLNFDPVLGSPDGDMEFFCIANDMEGNAFYAPMDQVWQAATDTVVNLAEPPQLKCQWE